MNTNVFQYAVLGIFILAIMVGVTAFALYGGVFSEPKIEATLWGTYPAETVQKVISSEALSGSNLTLSYVEKDPDTFQLDLLNALAEGAGPDLVLLSEELILQNLGKLSLITFDLYPERDFRDSFIDMADVLRTKDGVLALPLFVDPLVMYWNRPLHAGASLSSPIKIWEEAPITAPKLRALSSSNSLIRGAYSLGTVSNNQNASAVLSLLLLQAGAPIVKAADSNLGYEYVADVEGVRNVSSSGEAALRFFTEFSDPAKSTYSFSTAFSDARNAFLSGSLAAYFGFGSELSQLRAGNPNLDFDVSAVPERKNAVPVTYGHLVSVAIPKASLTSANLEAAYILTNTDVAAEFASALRLPPARRDLLAELPSDPFLNVFYKSALSAKTFLNPDRERVREAFREAVDGINSGRSSIADSAGRLEERIEAELSGVNR